jgi:hypothetical protein
MNPNTQVYADRFEAFLDDPKGAVTFEGAYSIAKWMRFAAIQPTLARKATCEEVMADRVSDGRMIRGLAQLGLGFATGTVVYMMAAPQAQQVAA